MARAKKETALTPEERLQSALVPDWEWPYKLPENWCWVKASSIINIYTGNSINEKVKAEKYAGQPKGLLFIATKDIGFDNAVNYEIDVRIPDYSNFKTAPANTALLCIEGGSAGRKVGFVEQRVCFGNKLCAFATEKVNSKYIYYVLQSQCFVDQFNSKKHGLIGGVSVGDLAEIAFMIPPLAEQQRIVDRIESLFAKLDEAKEKAQTVLDSFETRKAAILHKAFTGELTANWREAHGVGMESWDEKTLGEIIKVSSGNALTAKNMAESGSIPVYGGNGVAGHHDQSNVEADTVVIGRVGFYCGSVHYISEPAWVTDNALIVKYDKVEYDSHYLVYLLRHADLRQNDSSTAQPVISGSKIYPITVYVAKKDEQTEIVRILDDLFAKEQQAKEAAEAVLEKIDLMKKAILARAFRGELGTNDPADEPAVELLKKILDEE